MRDFEFLTPISIAEASTMLVEHGDNCRMIAGGTALLLGAAPAHGDPDAFDLAGAEFGPFAGSPMTTGLACGSVR